MKLRAVLPAPPQEVYAARTPLTRELPKANPSREGLQQPGQHRRLVPP